ncbi:Adenylate cyclase, class 3 [Shimia aestuarii]|uniref:Adenylate cyclase, class 3 n=2 Tax=Shimia aestuarii TaxID=254406 RepID=A0A1I4MXM6_9RHOB|nr:Adenylate cyclase, class 3 [Shimia aestuarii]
MVGFSRLIELDEVGTLARQKQLRLDVIEPTIGRHNGKVIKSTGDGLIVEFGSVVQAVQCAVEVQQELVERESERSLEERIQYRIAIHLGDVISDDNDLYGDGVNIAARLETLAEPGGIVVSGTAYDMLKTQVDVGYRSLGEKHLKNMAKPVRVYQVTSAENGPPKLSRSRRKLAVLTAALFAAGIVGAAWWWNLRNQATDHLGPLPTHTLIDIDGSELTSDFDGYYSGALHCSRAGDGPLADFETQAGRPMLLRVRNGAATYRLGRSEPIETYDGGEPFYEIMEFAITEAGIVKAVGQFQWTETQVLGEVVPFQPIAFRGSVDDQRIFVRGIRGPRRCSLELSRF